MIGVYYIGRSHAPSKSPTIPTSKIPITFSAFYLDVGASASLGFQPTGIKGHNGHSTLDGYGDDLVLMERYQGTALSIYKTGCPGETLQSFLSVKVSDHCNNLPVSQISKDRAFLQANRGKPGLITIDVGFNNYRVCLSPAVVNESCVTKAIAQTLLDIPKIVKDLRFAAGPHVRMVGLEYNDPFLAHYFIGSQGPAEALSTLSAMNRMNAALHHAYTSVGVKVADVPAFFRMNDTKPVVIPNEGTIPENVKAACDLTWLCYSSPFGPDDHPNDAGYSLIAKAILNELPKRW
jgi:lysophospholipase L1-like esterase